jgi:hypothetical protein
VGNKDKELTDYFNKLLQFSTIYISSIYAIENKKPNSDFDKDPIYGLTMQGLADIKEDLFNQFLDCCFGATSRMDRVEFIDKLSLDFICYLMP